MSLDSFRLFPLLPIEIRLHIWTLTFPKGRRIEPWTYEEQDDGFVESRLTRSRRAPNYRGPGFSCAKTDPVALWVNRESRHETLKHYTPRDYKHLEYLVTRDNVRYEAHIDFSRETIAFGVRAAGFLGPPYDRFILDNERGKVLHLESAAFIDGETFAEKLALHIRSYPKLEDILFHLKCRRIEGDVWTLWHDGPEVEESGSISTSLKEARQIAEDVFKAHEIERREAGEIWRAPLLVLRPCLEFEKRRCSIEEVRRLVEEARFTEKEDLPSEPVSEQ